MIKCFVEVNWCTVTYFDEIDILVQMMMHMQ